MMKGELYKKLCMMMLQNTIKQKKLQQFTILFHQRNDSSFDTKQSITMDTMDYGNPTTDALLITKRKKMEEETKS